MRTELRALPALALLAVACAQPEQDRRSALLELQPPVIERMEPAVRQELEQSLAGVRQLAGREDVTDEMLGRAYGELGRRYHAYELHRAAVNCYRNAETLMPEAYRWPYYLGQLYRTLDRLDEAERSFERAAALAPEDGPTWIALAHLYRDRLRLDDAAEIAGEVLSRDPDSVGAMMLQAELAQDRDEPAVAIEWYERVLHLQPEATRLYRLLAVAHRSLGQERQAREALALDGDGSPTIEDPLMAELQMLRSGARQHVARGIAAFNNGDFEGAAQAFASAVRVNPGDVGARLNLGSALARLGRLDDAVKAYEGVLELDPGHAMAYFNLGVVVDRLGDVEGSIAHYEKALDIVPNYRDPLFQLALLRRRIGRCEEALPQFRQVLELDPRNLRAWVGEAGCLNTLGRGAEALERMEEASQVLPVTRPLDLMTARLLAASPDDGVRDGARALELAEGLVAAGRDRESLTTFAMALAENGRFAEAVEAQREAIALVAESDAARVERMTAQLAAYERSEPSRDPDLR
jgi:tetratricopeptide (TPR) repeat protein